MTRRINGPQTIVKFLAYGYATAVFAKWQKEGRRRQLRTYRPADFTAGKKFAGKCASKARRDFFPPIIIPFGRKEEDDVQFGSLPAKCGTDGRGIKQLSSPPSCFRRSSDEFRWNIISISVDGRRSKIQFGWVIRLQKLSCGKRVCSDFRYRAAQNCGMNVGWMLISRQVQGFGSRLMSRLYNVSCQVGFVIVWHTLRDSEPTERLAYNHKT